MESLPLVSVIIPVYNDEDTIEICLISISNQEFQNKEIIVVDDGSLDNTEIILSRMAKAYPSLKVIRINHSGLTVAKNVGLENAKGEIILFAEGDAVYSKKYLTNAIRLMTSKAKLGGVCLPGLPWIAKSTFASQCIDIEKRISLNLLNTGKILPFYAWVYRKEAIDAAGWFDEDLFQAEDRDMFLRVKRKGYVVGLIPGVHWRHLRKQDTKEFFKRACSGGRTRVRYLLKHRKISELLKGVIPFWLLIVAFSLVLAFPQLLIATLLFAVPFIAYKWLTTLRLGWNCTSNRKYLFAIILFFLIRYAATALGYSYGMLTRVGAKLFHVSRRGRISNRVLINPSI